jgi:hypothetical protein
MADVEVLYRQQLTRADLRLLEEVVGPGAPVTTALAATATEQAVFGPREGDGLTVGLSPFLTFAVAVHRTAAGLEQATSVQERFAPRVLVPVFDVTGLRAVLADPLRRYVLVELLASYTRVVSGVTWTRTSRGWQRRRYSELDVVRMAGMLEVVKPAERPGIYRRLGDLALFTTGVFPDAPVSLGGSGRHRLLRLSGVSLDAAEDLPGVTLLERLGPRWYRMAGRSARAAGTPMTSVLAVAGDLADRFDDARRVLNVVTDRYLFPLRDHWFGGPAA